MQHRTDTQIAVWTAGPSDRDEDRLFLVLDVAAGELSARIERDRIDPATGRVTSVSEDMTLASALAIENPRLFAAAIEKKLILLMAAEV